MNTIKLQEAKKHLMEALAERLVADYWEKIEVSGFSSEEATEVCIEALFDKEKSLELNWKYFTLKHSSK